MKTLKERAEEVIELAEKGTQGGFGVFEKTHIMAGRRLIATTSGYTNTEKCPIAENEANARFLVHAHKMAQLIADQQWRITELEELEKWQPIETAPKDGSLFLGANIGGIPYTAYYNDELEAYVCDFQTDLLPHRPEGWKPLPKGMERGSITITTTSTMHGYKQGNEHEAKLIGHVYPFKGE